MFSIRTVLALAALLAVSAEDATEDAPAAAAVEYAEVTTLFRAAETDVLRFRHSRDPRGKGNDTHLVSALAKYEELQARADFTSSLDEQTRVLVLDSCEFCSRKLVQHEGALKYAKALADSRLCRLDADGCFASGARPLHTCPPSRTEHTPGWLTNACVGAGSRISHRAAVACARADRRRH